MSLVETVEEVAGGYGDSGEAVLTMCLNFDHFIFLVPCLGHLWFEVFTSSSLHLVSWVYLGQICHRDH